MLFPTPTANLGTYRQAGTNRLETWLREHGLIANGSQLSAIAYALIQGYPPDWFSALGEEPTMPLLALLAPQEESEPENWPVEPLPPAKLLSPSNESCTSMKCSTCNAFDGSIPESSPYKFCLAQGRYLKPDELDGCNDYLPIIPYQAPTPIRRSKGDGSGHIEKRLCNGTDQYWFAYELHQDGQCLVKSSVYIPKGKLKTIQQMNDDKVPVTEILAALGKLQGDNSTAERLQGDNLSLIERRELQGDK
ncbi:MAG: hypothetical protein ACKN9E_12100 [Microcystaceae cyanobacterium]